ncbi:deoxyguanosinetriphosphate triphosphohydrolase [Listeria sp. ILCC797]|uniref:deoxyguanosinetriphosphate triphosphohydrolase n=1 Tax=Listeria sp. ILCC797 TaxID=1918333 RepID=UPI000B58901C|nr:deoxyguanosinetriphosphate triphosphohydrolase [Listeria sp. ILCC797]
MQWQDLLTVKRTSNPSKTVSPDDLRNAFENDYQRIIISASFRRLQDKTQVFPLEKNDFVRTRLTHSLEVSQIAKSLGTRVGTKIINERLDPSFTEKNIKELSDLLACSGLLHDMGNPPFGHFGECAIRQWFSKNLSKIKYGNDTLGKLLTEQMQKDFTHFEGNAQVLRLLTKLHQLFESTHGMNLTCATVNSLFKYPTPSVKIDKNKESDVKLHKMGYFYADKDTFSEITEATTAGDNRHPAAFLLEAADDISYLLADLEDGMKKKLFSLNQLITELSPLKGSPHKELSACYEYLEEKARYSNELLSFQQWITVKVRGILINNTIDTFINNYTDIMSGHFESSLLEASKVSSLSSLLGEICCKYIFTNCDIQKVELAGKKIIFNLLDTLIPAVLYFDSPLKEDNKDEHKRLRTLLSQNYIDAYNKYKPDNDTEKLYLRLLLVTDTICGMTDSYAKSLYQELNGIS